MKKNVAFTICAKNYIGLAQVLEQSINRYSSDFSFFIFIADELDETLELTIPSNTIISKKNLSAYFTTEEWHEMSFKYNLTEFCTLLKPFCFQYLFEEMKANKVVYLDPDILFFSDIGSIFSHLDEHNIILTPHLLNINDQYEGDRPELGILSTGVFNLGFLGLKKSIQVNKMLSWWGIRLKKYCFIDPLEGSFTDQRWMDFLPCFFESSDLLISKNMGLNLAPWNFFERRIVENSENNLEVISRDIDDSSKIRRDVLSFVHYSGYNYESIISGSYEQKNIPTLKSYDDLAPVFKAYSKALNANKESILSFFELKYSYGYFDNGVLITAFHRRLFRSFLNSHNTPSNPFATGKSSFFDGLKQASLISVNNSKLEKVNKENISNLARKMKVINYFMRIVLKIIGVNRYSLLIKFFRPYSRFENQIFLIDKNQNPL